MQRDQNPGREWEQEAEWRMAHISLSLARRPEHAHTLRWWRSSLTVQTHDLGFASSSVLTEAKVRYKQITQHLLWSYFRNKDSRISAWKLSAWNLLTLTAPFHFSPLSVLVFSQLLYNLTSIYSSLWALSSISTILSPQPSTAWLSLSVQIGKKKSLLFSPGLKSISWSQWLWGMVIRNQHSLRLGYRR